MTDLMTKLGAAMFAEAPFPVALLDREHRILRANASFERSFGSWRGRRCYAVYKGRERRCEDCGAARALELGTSQTAEEACRGADGAPLHHRTTSLPLRTNDGAVEHVLQISIDVTRRKDLEQQLGQAERMARVGLSAAGLAHTIKNILAGLEGAVYTVDAALERGQAERVAIGWDMVRKYVEQVQALVRNLLSYAREQQPRRGRVEPGALVEEVVELYGDRCSLASVRIEGRVAGGLRPIEGDPQSLQACLANLVANALDACTWDPDTGKDHRISVEVAASPGGTLLFKVDDNGMGIAPQNQSKVLSSHFTTKGIRGTGLGLLLTKKAVEEHGGSIRFTSQPGQGTTFLVELPSAIPAPRAPWP